MQQLHKDQEYVYGHAARLGIPAALRYHPRATDTCLEKLELLQECPDLSWQLDQIIKAVFFERKSHTVGIISPEFGTKIPVAEIVTILFGKSRHEAKEYRPCKDLPLGMEFGTCTPFIFQSSMDYDIKDLVIIDHPRIEDLVCDVSIGGFGIEAHKTSMHLSYRGIYKILAAEFSDRVHRYLPSLTAPTQTFYTQS